MIFLTGETTGIRMTYKIKTYGFGRMFVEKTPVPFENELWGFDNGAYIWWKKGLDFQMSIYTHRLSRAMYMGVPYIAVLPDIVGEGIKSLEFSLAWHKKLPAHYPWYLAVQDGMTEEMIEPVIGDFKGIFLGGTDDFKETDYKWCKFAHKHNKLFHYGRAGTLKKIKRAYDIGSDSLDSAFPLWTDERLKQTADLIHELNNNYKGGN